MSWEQYAPTSDSQLERLARLKAACGGEEVEAVVRRNQGASTPIQKLGDSAKPAGIAALYKESYAGDGAPGGGVDDLGEKARERGVQLREYVRTCQGFVADVERAVHLLDTIAQQQEQVTSKTQALHATCESLLAEQKRLESQVEALSAPLQRFGALEELGPALGLPFASTGRGDGTGGASGGGAPLRTMVGGGGGVARARLGGGGGTPRSGSIGGGGRERVLLHPGSKEFAEALERANSAMIYLRQHPEFIEGSQYMDKYAQLLSRALALVKNQAVEYLEQAARLSAEKPVVEGRLETSEIYSRFRGVSHRVNAGVGLMRKYVSSAPLIKTLLSDFRQLYFEKRLALLRPAVRSHLEAMSKQRGLTAMIRFGAAFLVRVGQLETQLYDACLGDEDENDNNTARDTTASSSKGGVPIKEAVRRSEGGEGDRGEEKTEGEGGVEGAVPDAEEEADMEEGRAGLYGMLLVLCSELHKNLRPRVYHGTDMDTLCELVSVIREEIVEEQRGRHGLSQVRVGGGVEGEAGAQGEAAIETVLMKLVQDSQERLIYMATKVIQDDIAGFRPAPEHLDYPRMLLQARGDPRGASSTDQALSGPGTQAASPPPGAAYTTWYPPLRSTLQVLSKVYRAVDMGVFEDLAQLAVAACAETMKRAAVAISTGVLNNAKTGVPPSSGAGGAVGEAGEGGLDAHLFLIKHLLTLREQLTPFRIQFVRAEHKLNFGSTRMALRKFIRHTPALFRLSSKNALVELTLDSIPTIDEIQVDAKGDMEASLKSACSAFIACAVDLVGSPLLSWASKARAFEERGEEGMASLRAQPFASPARVKETVHAALFSAAAALPQVCAAMSLYLDNKATEGILLHPVQRRVVDTVDGVREVLHKLHPPEDLEEIIPLLARVSQLALSTGEDNGPPPPSSSPEGLEVSEEPEEEKKLPEELKPSR